MLKQNKLTKTKTVNEKAKQALSRNLQQNGYCTTKLEKWEISITEYVMSFISYIECLEQQRKVIRILVVTL